MFQSNNTTDVDKKSTEQGLGESESRIKELEKVIEDKERLLRVIAHDIKGPIGSVAGLSQLLLESNESGTLNKEELVKVLKMISTVGENIVILVDELSEWNQRDMIELNISTTGLIGHIKNIEGLLLPQLTAKQIEFKNAITNDFHVLADPKMLRIILRNLSSNAIKFTKPGGHITISCEKKKDLVKIYIADDGIGLSEERKSKLLNELLGDTTLGTDGEKGTGLGLPLCIDFVNKMGGSMHVESAGEGKGTTFIIELPAGEK